MPRSWVDVHHPNVRRLPREQHPARVGGRDELEGAVGERDAVGARVRASRGGQGAKPSVSGRGQAVRMLNSAGRCECR